MKPDTQFVGDDLRRADPKFRPPLYARYLQAVERLDRFAQENYGKRVLDLAVRWTLGHPCVSVALWVRATPSSCRLLITPMGGSWAWTLCEQSTRSFARRLLAPLGRSLWPRRRGSKVLVRLPERGQLKRRTGCNKTQPSQLQ